MNLIHEYDQMLSLVSSNASSKLVVVLGTPNIPAFPQYQSTALNVPLLFSLVSSDYIIPNSDLAKENLPTIFWRVNRFCYCNQERKEQYILFWMCIYVFYSLIWFYFSFFWWLRQNQLVTVFFYCRFKICLFADFKILLTVYPFLNTSNILALSFCTSSSFYLWCFSHSSAYLAPPFQWVLNCHLLKKAFPTQSI